MAKYTPGMIAKALTAAATTTIGALFSAALAKAGGDPAAITLGSLDLGTVLTALGLGLGAGGATFRVPNVETPGAVERATASAAQSIDQIDAKLQASKENAIKAAKEFQDTLGLPIGPNRSPVQQAIDDVLGGR